jgi:hypothetical protein
MGRRKIEIQPITVSCAMPRLLPAWQGGGGRRVETDDGNWQHERNRSVTFAKVGPLQEITWQTWSSAIFVSKVLALTILNFSPDRVLRRERTAFSRKPTSSACSALSRSLSSSLVSLLAPVYPPSAHVVLDEKPGHGPKLYQNGSREVSEVVKRHLAVIIFCVHPFIVGMYH